MIRRSLQALLIAAPLVLSTSCMTTRFSQETVIQTKTGEGLTHTFEKSYDTSGWGTSCLITAIFYGGTCWAYLGMPYEYQAKTVKSDATSEMFLKYGENGFNVKQERETARIGYDEKPMVSVFQGTQAVIVTNAKGKEEAVSESNSLPPMAAPELLIPVATQSVTKPEKLPVLEKKNTLKDLSDPLVIQGHEVIVRSSNPDAGRYRNSVSLSLKLRNNGSRRVTAYELKVKLSTKLGRSLGTFTLTSETSSIDPEAVENAAFSWEDNRFIPDEVYDNLSAVATENLKVKLVSQKVVKAEAATLSH